MGKNGTVTASFCGAYNYFSFFYLYAMGQVLVFFLSFCYLIWIALDLSFNNPNLIITQFNIFVIFIIHILSYI